MALEKALETYKRELPNLLASKGKFVLIADDEVIDIFAAYEDAVKEGYKRFKLDPFLVKRIEAEEHVECFTRPIIPVASLSQTR